MKVVLLSEVFSKKMGYLGNLLPKYLARLGVEVHLVTMDLPPYYHIKDIKKTYGRFFDPDELVPGAIEAYDGFTLHVLAHRNVLGYMRMVGLSKKLSSIRPDIVQTMSAIGWIPLDAAVYKTFCGYELFTGCHMTASVFRLANRELPWWNRERLQCRLTRAFPGRLASLFTQRCYAATEDCALIASRYFGVQSEKVEVMYLGVDTELFYPVISETMARDRFELRRQLGFKEDDVVCIYTGKFTDDKKVRMLAEVVERLRANGQSLRAMFIGDGPQRKTLEGYSSSVILDFLPFVELAPYYRAADIGVWPGNESTSMLDAAACGLPIVISDEVHYRAPVEGNGRVFKRDSSQDLERVLLELGQPQTRQRLGSSGAERMARDFSWESLARQRLRDYEEALRVKRPLREGKASRESF